MRKVIGVSISYNSSACVVDAVNGIEFAISEERLINEKNTRKFPINAIKKCAEYIPLKDNIHFAFCGYETLNARTFKYVPDLLSSDIVSNDFYATMRVYLARHLKVSPANIIISRVNHHEAHKLAAVYMSGFLPNAYNNLISVTYDGFGDGLCATISDARNNEVLSRIQTKFSIALIYQFVTGALGFKEHQHEGKITGLAAFGTPSLVHEFEKLICYDNLLKTFVSNYAWAGHYEGIPYNTNIDQFGDFLCLKNAVYNLVKRMQKEGIPREDIAASLQLYTEQQIVQWISNTLQDTKYEGNADIVLSGGLFANVKVNYAIKKHILSPHNDLFVLPAMGDEGTCIGAAIHELISFYGKKFLNLKAFSRDVLYYGHLSNSLEYDQICALLDDQEGYEILKYNTLDSVLPLITKYLQKNKIVCISRGSSEFGPRALGNHTILFDATKKETNDWLNARLSRTEFMPFAPIVLDKFTNSLFENYKGLSKTLKYMTIALPVTMEFLENYKAAYHIDGTARPQIISETDNEFVYAILKAYYERTQKKVLINTSFNLHNYPIIADDEIAISSFLKADLDMLILDDVIIIKGE